MFKLSRTSFNLNSFSYIISLLHFIKLIEDFNLIGNAANILLYPTKFVFLEWQNINIFVWIKLSNLI